MIRIVVFWNDADDAIRMEISAYLPFKILKEDIIP